MSIDLEVGSLVSFNSEYRHKLPFPLKGVGIVSSLSTTCGQIAYNVLFPIGKIFNMPRAWLIEIPAKNPVCPLEEEDMMWGDR